MHAFGFSRGEVLEREGERERERELEREREREEKRKKNESLEGICNTKILSEKPSLCSS